MKHSYLRQMAERKTPAEIDEMIAALNEAKIIAVRDEYVALMKRIILQYEEGAITVKEMANALVARTVDVIDQLPADPDLGVPEWLVPPAPEPVIAPSVEELADFVMTVTDHSVDIPSKEPVGDDDIPF